MDSIDAFAAAKLEELDGFSLRRRLATTERDSFPYVERNGRRLLSFSCNDYLGLSTHPALKAAAMAAIEAEGAGAGASRLVTGNHPLYAELETRLARMKGTEAACVFGSGYLANIGVLGVFAGPADLIVIDELAHACLNAGAQLSRATLLRFRHNDARHAAALLAAHRPQHRHALVVTETVFSMDGDRAPLPDLAELCTRQKAWLMTDDAHGFAVVDHVDGAHLQMGTLSKAVGSYGGYCCASQPVVELLVTRARSLIYSTGLPPAVVAASIAALKVIEAEPGLAAAPLRKARAFTAALGLSEAQSAIVPLVVGAPEAALALSARLAEAGFLVTAIRPPTVPPGTARLRFAFSALHPDAEVARLAATLTSLTDAANDRALCPAFS